MLPASKRDSSANRVPVKHVSTRFNLFAYERMKTPGNPDGIKVSELFRGATLTGLIPRRLDPAGTACGVEEELRVARGDRTEFSSREGRGATLTGLRPLPVRYAISASGVDAKPRNSAWQSNSVLIP